MQNNPLNKVVFIQKVASFAPLAVQHLFQLAYVNNYWSDTIKNYSFHLFEGRARVIVDEDTDYLEPICRFIFWCRVTWFVEVLMFSKTVLDRVNVSRCVCEHNTPLHMMNFVFQKIVDAGGKDLLKNQLAATTGRYCRSCLMLLCSRGSSSPEVLRLLFDKIDEVGGKEFLIIQVTATDKNGCNCLMQCCGYSSSPEVMLLVFDKIIEAGGTDLLRSQFTATNSEGRSCLMQCCHNSTSPELLKLVFEKIVEVGSKTLLESQLAATTRTNWTCLMFSGSSGYSASPEAMKFLAVALFVLNLFKAHHKMLGYMAKMNLREKAGITVSWSPDPTSIAEVEKLLQGADGGGGASGNTGSKSLVM